MQIYQCINSLYPEKTLEMLGKLKLLREAKWKRNKVS
jgi:hypothetical protein